MQVSSEMDIGHDDSATSEHDIGRAFNSGAARDFVAGILILIS